MTQLTTVQLDAPYLILIGDLTDPSYAKTGFGIVHWRPERVAGQLRFAGCEVDLGIPDLSIAEAVEAGVRSLIIGVAPVGGIVPESWWDSIEEAARAGLDIVCGLHLKLADKPAIAAAAQESGARLIDVRTPPPGLPVGNGKKRRGRRLLMVGTDCVSGKKYSALALHDAMQDAGMKSTFRATGQTGIMLAGEGIAIDAVVADFVSGAAELLSPDNDDDHWDIIEGQGSLLHPGYSGVSLGLLHGSQPDAFVVCHDASRTAICGWEHYTLPDVQDCIEQHVIMGRLTNPKIRCVGISVNTAGLTADGRIAVLDQLRKDTGLPCVDPLIDGCGAIIEKIKQLYPEN